MLVLIKFVLDQFDEVWRSNGQKRVPTWAILGVAGEPCWTILTNFLGWNEKLQPSSV